MAELSPSGDSSADIDAPAAASAPQRRGPGHRGADASDTAAEMARRAHEISLEAGNRMSGAMRDVIRSAAGLSAFAIESARELIHYMVRRGQMNPDEAKNLIAEAESAYIEKHGSLPEPEPPKPAPKPQPLNARPAAAKAAAEDDEGEEEEAETEAPAKSVSKTPAKTAAKAPAKTAAKAPAKTAAKAPAKTAAKAPAKTAAKKAAKKK